jgi:hypothetical protein
MSQCHIIEGPFEYLCRMESAVQAIIGGTRQTWQCMRPYGIFSTYRENVYEKRVQLFT